MKIDKNKNNLFNIFVKNCSLCIKKPQKNNVFISDRHLDIYAQTTRF